MSRKVRTLLLALPGIALVVLMMSYQVPQREGMETETGTAAAGSGDADSGNSSTNRPQRDAASDPSESDVQGGALTTSTSVSPASPARVAEPTGPMLSQRVFYIIQEAQLRQMDEQWEEALNELNALYTDFDSLTPFEQTTLLNFYTNALIRLEMWQESISAFTLMLTIDELRPDITARALLALGQLHTRVGETSAATTYFEGWLDFTRDMEGLEQQTALVREQLNATR